MKVCRVIIKIKKQKINLNKYTKAELISKYKEFKSNKENNSKLDIIHKINFLIKINTYLSKIWDLMLTFKNIITKLTLISFFIKIFRKYRIFRRLWMLMNIIVITIFGISLLENLGIEHIQHLFNEIRFIISNIVDYFTNTHFYNYFTKLFSNNESDLTNKTTNKNWILD
uniref:hypothetical protein n=1 Tax=Russula emetica TaxID=152958 RepID=UPI0031F46F18